MAAYVDNSRFVSELEAYKLKLKDEPTARIPDYIGECILEICKRFSTRPNFNRYSYRDEMVSDAVENCLMYLTNFDSAKSTNAFSYFTQIAYFAFLRRIAREKKQGYIKHQLVQGMSLDTYDLNEFDDTELSQNFLSYIQSHNSFEYTEPPKKVKSKVNPRKWNSLDEFMEE